MMYCSFQMHQNNRIKNNMIQYEQYKLIKINNKHEYNQKQ